MNQFIHYSNDNPNRSDCSLSLSTLTLGMGCFWGPEARFGQFAGVWHTRTGYAGGTTENPTYRNIGDHSETVEITFDPNVITLEQLLEQFWAHHTPSVINGYKGRQYQSLLFYRDSYQYDVIQQGQQNVARYQQDRQDREQTELQPFSVFYPAEDRHQKYYLQRKPEIMERMDELFQDQDAELFIHSPLSARLNAWSRDYITLGQLDQELDSWSLTRKQISMLKKWFVTLSSISV